MSITQHGSFLRRALLADAHISGVTGLMMFGGASFLAGFLLLPEALLRSAGLVLLPFAVFVGVVASREQVSSAAVRVVIVINAVWALSSIALLVTGTVAPNMLGHGFVLVQAIAVAVFAELQVLGLRRSPPQLA